MSRDAPRASRGVLRELGAAAVAWEASTSGARDAEGSCPETGGRDARRALRGAAVGLSCPFLAATGT